ncbi:hypothetical protein P7C70_g6260, partial [Phenoliferia sp. Uapishka_3]
MGQSVSSHVGASVVRDAGREMVHSALADETDEDYFFEEFVLVAHEAKATPAATHEISTPVVGDDLDPDQESGSDSGTAHNEQYFKDWARKIPHLI